MDTHCTPQNMCAGCKAALHPLGIISLTNDTIDPPPYPLNEVYDVVDKPPHYQGKKFETIDIIEDFELGFHLGNAIKYILRAGKKDNKFQDLKKAIWYLERECANVVAATVNSAEGK